MKRLSIVVFSIILLLFISGCQNQVNFSLYFDSNGGSGVQPIKTDGKSVISLPDDPTKDGYTFGGWYWDNETFSNPFTAKSLLDSPLSSNMTVFAEWIEGDNSVPVGSIKVTFNSMGGTDVEQKYVQKGSTIPIPAVARTGYTLDGWYTSLNGGETLDEKWSFTSSIVQNEIILYAKWTINQYTISFNSNEGSTVTTITQDYATTITEPIPTREGYVFNGWYSDTDLTQIFSFKTMPASDMTLYAKWRTGQYTISFNSNGGSAVTSITQDYSTSVNTPTSPTKIGYIFGGWYSDSGLTHPFYFTTMPATNTTLYAKWIINQYTISFNSNGGSTVTSITQDYATTVTEPIPTKEGYAFSGWYSDTGLTQIFSFKTMPAINTTLYAKWTAFDYEISFEENGGTTVKDITQGYETTVSKPTDPTRTGYTFAGWYSDIGLTTPYVFATMPLDGISLYAKWIINQYTISFNSNGGSAVTSITQDYASTITEPIPTREGYAFSGWYSDTSLTQIFSFKTMPAINTTLYAKWIINQYTISFNSNGGSTVTSITEDYATTVTEPIPTKEGYAFSGWYSDISLTQIFSFKTMPAINTTLYAKWTINQYTISFNSNGGSTVTSITQDYATTVTEPIPTKEGYAFSGWYSDTSLTQIFSFKTMPATNTTLYAKWTINQYKITYSIIDVDPLSHIVLNPGETISQVSLGSSHSAALTSYGRLFMWGANSRGQLGDGTTTNKSVPTEITSQFCLTLDDQIIQVSLGGNNSSALTSNGRLFMWGDNLHGQLGIGTLGNGTYIGTSNIPVEVTSQISLSVGDQIIQVSLGGSYSSALTSNGRLFMWGANYNGQLGDSTTIDKFIPTEITSRFILTSADKIIQVSLGNSHSSALSTNGQIFTWGKNFYGQLGDGTTTGKFVPTKITSQFSLTSGDKIIQVSLGYSFSTALTTNGQLFMWGANYDGQLGDNTGVNKSVPTKITNQFNLEIGDKIIQVSLGDSYSSAITLNGSLFIWGDNYYYQLGDGTSINRYEPKDITSKFDLKESEKITSVFLSYSHSAALTSNGGLFMWGVNGNGQLGDNTTVNKSVPSESNFYMPSILLFESYDYNANINDYTPIREGYTFGGWYSDLELTQPYEFSTMPARNINLYGKWIPNE